MQELFSWEGKQMSLANRRWLGKLFMPFGSIDFNFVEFSEIS